MDGLRVLGVIIILNVKERKHKKFPENARERASISQNDFHLLGAWSSGIPEVHKYERRVDVLNG